LARIKVDKESVRSNLLDSLKKTLLANIVHDAADSIHIAGEVLRAEGAGEIDTELLPSSVQAKLGMGTSKARAPIRPVPTNELADTADNKVTDDGTKG